MNTKTVVVNNSLTWYSNRCTCANDHGDGSTRYIYQTCIGKKAMKILISLISCEMKWDCKRKTHGYIFTHVDINTEVCICK